MTSLMKPRSGYSGFARNQVSKHTHKSGHGGQGGQGGQRNAAPVGKWDYLILTEDPIWVSLCPSQKWKYERYDRDQQQVVEEETEYFYYEEHYVAATRKKFSCSAGAHMDQECFGCSERARFYEARRKIQDETGTIPEGMKNAPISKLGRFVLSVTVLEELGDFPKKDKTTGLPVKSKRGTAIFTQIPMRFAKRLRPNETPKAKYFGKKYHYTFGPDYLDALAAEHAVLETKCANCTEDLTAIMALCPECGQAHDTEWDVLPAEELIEDKKLERECTHCGHVGTSVYEYHCACGSPAEGGLFAFELQISATAEDNRIPKIHRVRARQDYSHIQGAEDLIFVPLDLPAIFAPEPLQYQARNLDERRRQQATNDAHIKQRRGEEKENLGAGGDSEEPVDFYNY